MDISFYPLEVLSRAIHYKNLTAASLHVGLSQPQLSRLIGALEKQMQIVLLDRSSRRKSAWTPRAHELAQAFALSRSRLLRTIQELQEEAELHEISAACLEGLAALAIEQIKPVLKMVRLKNIRLDVLDQSELDQKFVSGDLDLVWTALIPSKSKPKYIRELGYQTLEERDNKIPIEILSPFELDRSVRRKKEPDRRLISNSLLVRQLWFETIGGRGRFPSSVYPDKAKNRESVLLIGASHLPEKVWNLLIS